MHTTAIFGPPGTGKTTEMLRRLQDAVDRGYKRDEIGFFSFTKSASGEALRRLGIQHSPLISTLHSLAFRSGGYMRPSVVDAYKLRKFGHVAGVRFSGGQSDEFGEHMEVGDRYLALHSLALATGRTPEQVYYDSDDRVGDFAQFKYTLDSYESWKTAYGYVDFSDMIQGYARNPVNHGARVLFIDEAQDLSRLQWQMIRAMVSFDQVAEVVIAGDDDQAIYEWAGADPHGMASFKAEHNAQEHVLKQSYRVPKVVHGVARGVVQTIENRVKKMYRPRQGEGEVVRWNNGFDAAMVSHGEDAMILCRSHPQRKEVEELLVASRKPYRVMGGKAGLYDSIWADGVRVIHRLAAGESIGKLDLERLTKVATPRALEHINARDFSKLTQLGAERAIKLPPQLIEFFRDADLSQTPTITVSTIHASKGREAERVVLHTGITARIEAGMDRNADAEARVWYVAVTRAKERLDVVDGAERSYEVNTNPNPQ